MTDQAMAEAKDWVPHPGEYLREELEARGWSQRDLAFILGCPVPAVNMLVSGKRGISPDMAKALGDAFGVPSELFSNLQRAYDLAHARDPHPGIAKRARLLAGYPFREMINRGWLQDADAPVLEHQLAKFFGVSDINDVPHLAHAAKRTPTRYDEVPSEQLVWLFRVRQISSTMHVQPYSEKKLRETLPRLVQLLNDSEGIRHVPRLLMECGVRFVLVEPLPGSKIDGVCFWLDKNSPVIGMSLRLDRIDNFWFVLRHEIDHVLNKHGQEQEVIDVELEIERDLRDEERIANASAADFCVPKREMDDFVARKAPFFSERDVRGFATIMQRHPGIIVGQIHIRTKEYKLLRKYLIRVRSFAVQGAIVDGWGETFPIKT